MMKYRFNVAMFIYMCLVPVACIMLQAISSTLVYSICNDSSTHLTPYISFLAYALYIALFGYGYYKLVKPVDISDDRHKHKLLLFEGEPVMVPLRFFAIIMCGFLFQAFVTGILYCIQYNFPHVLDDYNRMVADNFAADNGFLQVLTVILLAPVGEELAFRGLGLAFAFNIFSPKTFDFTLKPEEMLRLWNGEKKDKKITAPKLVAVIFTALLFGAYHANVIQFCYAFPMGIIFALMAIWSNSILPSIILHISINTFSYLMPDIMFNTPVAAYITVATSFVLLAIALRQSYRAL